MARTCRSELICSMCAMPRCTLSIRSTPWSFPSTTSARFSRPSTSLEPWHTPWHLQLELLQETTDEMARNGCKKVLIVNGHGGNESLLPFFAQSQMEKPHDYVVYVLGLVETPPGGPAKKTKIDMHAGESETSKMLISRPDLVHMDRAASESGADMARLKLPENVYTGIWWYARFP